jgi:ABC-type glycerol-3-phosphate transport system substrate-binding protein
MFSRRITLASAAFLAATALTTPHLAEAQGIKTVRYLNQETDPTVVAIQRGWVESFVAENLGIDVILEGAPAGVINQRIATYVQAGAPLDVVHADGGSAARAAAAGLLEPLNDVVEALGGRDAFLPGRLLVYEDNVYSINQAGTSPQLHYRKDLFEAAGLEPPTTWEELIHAARTLHSDEVAGIALPGGENRATTIYAGIFLWQNCGDFFDPDLNVTLDNERTAEALRFYADLLEYTPPDSVSWAFNEPIESFWSGRSAMVAYWHGLDLTFRQNPDLVENIGVVPMPAGKMRVTEQGGRYVSVFNSSESIDESKKWVQYIFTPENAQKLSETTPMLYPPATEAGIELLKTSESPQIQAYGDILFEVTYPTAEFAYNQIFNGGGIDPETCTIRETGVVNPFVSVVWNSNLYARAVQQVAFQDRDPAEAAAEAHAAIAEQVAVAKTEMGN